MKLPGDNNVLPLLLSEKYLRENNMALSSRKGKKISKKMILKVLRALSYSDRTFDEY